MSEEVIEEIEEMEAQHSFVEANAEYFSQTLSPLNSIFRNSGMMNIISEESECTVAVGITIPDDDGNVDVDCAMLEANQESLQDCINSLFI